MVFFAESWFWRGTQSAIFYYVACTPWVEYKHNRKRRKEAEKARKEREENVIYTQPGVLVQPVPFQTNEEWAQEIIQGPGPPKGWKKDSLYYKYSRATKEEASGQITTRRRAETTTSINSPAKSDWTATTGSSSTAVASIQRPLDAHIKDEGGSRRDLERVGSREVSKELCKPASNTLSPSNGELHTQSLPNSTSTTNNIQPNSLLTSSRVLHTSSSHETGTTGSRRSSFASSLSEDQKPRPPRPSMEKRLSNAMDGFKDAMRGALNPERWNWIRYDRDDEILPNWNEKVKGMWGSVKEHMSMPIEEGAMKLKQVETQESRAENEVRKWQRGTHPALNDLHPPVVSQLPYTADEAKWMLLPPPSADVMMGRARPNAVDNINRQPLCVIGRPVPPVQSGPDTELRSSGSDEENQELSDSGEEEWLAGWTHLQKPQRPHLWKQRASYML